MSSQLRILALVETSNLTQLLPECYPSEHLVFTHSVADALQQMLVHQFIPDLILIDAPDRIVLDFLQALHRDRYLALIPVIFCYAPDLPHDRQRLLTAGMTDILPKPFGSEALVHTVEKHRYTRQLWWETFDIQASENPEDILKMTRPALMAPEHGAAQDFVAFRSFLYQQLHVPADRIKYMQPYNSRQLFHLGEALYLDSLQLAEYMGAFLSVSVLHDLDEYQFLPGVMPGEYCRKNWVLPLEDRYGRQAVALANPFQLEVLDIVLRLFKGKKILVAPPELIEDVLDPHFRTTPAYRDWIVRRERRYQSSPAPLLIRHEHPPDPPLPQGELGTQQLERSLSNAYLAYQRQLANPASQPAAEVELNAEVAPLIQLVNTLIENAHQMQASDIHIEPYEHDVVVRYRVDGEMRVIQRLEPQSIIRPIMVRLKIMSQLDISERRLPQDGRIHFVEFNPACDIDLRLSIVPLKYGEKAVMRILDRNQNLVGIDEMGFSEQAMSLYRAKLAAPYGMILHVGPTGSGKTTTLYAALQEINDPAINIHTIEDPVEYTLPGVHQLEVRHHIGLTFARALRAYLRQDPDVILVGEIRDEETAHIAVEAALTGHLLLSTLHTNDACATVIRLLEMGIKPYMISSSLLLICAQRLLRRLCSACARSYTPDQEVLGALGVAHHPDLVFYEPVGCEECEQRGYQGRIGVYELLVLDEAVRAAMNEPNPRSEDIKAEARRSGALAQTLFQDGITKVLAGLTSLEEVTLKLMPD